MYQFQKSRKLILAVVLTACFILAFQFVTYEHVSYIQKTVKDIHQKAVNLAQGSSKKIWEYYDLSEVPVDRVSPNDSMILLNIEKEVMNFPAEFLMKRGNKGGDCGKMPPIYEIKFINTHWQQFIHSNGTFSLLNAYYDNRAALDAPLVRIAMTVNRVKPRHNITCQLWFKDVPNPVFSQVFEYRYLWRDYWGYNDEKMQQPYIAGCAIPKKYWDKAPEAVSLVEHPCDTAINVLKVHNNRPADGVKKNFGVCVKQLDFLYNDMSVILVEWLEVLFSMGVEKVHLYNVTAHYNMVKVLRYYEEQGKVEFRPITLPGAQPNIPSLYHQYFFNNLGRQLFFEDMLFNDCFYRNMYNFKWLAVIDIDELIMPIKNLTTWNDILQSVEQSPDIEGYGFRNLFYFDDNKYFNVTHEDVAPYLHFTNLVHRAANHSDEGYSTKSWFNTERVVSIHNHYAIDCVKSKDWCNWHEVSTDVARMQHYCINKKHHDYCTNYENNTVVDPNIWKYKEEVTKSTMKTMEDLNFIHKN
ncbi:hypothetical protein ACFFRR_002583 [Megaselia abdita]